MSDEILNGDDDIFPINLDYDGPGEPVFRPNPNDRADGWINATVDFTAKYVASGSRKNLDGWLVYGDEETVEDVVGVGGYTAQLSVGEDIEEALLAAPSSSPTLPADSEDNDAYCFVASAVDDLGNESDLPDEDAGCADPADSKEAMDAIAAVEGVGEVGEDNYVAPVEAADAADAEIFSTLTAGVDTAAPTLEFTTSPKSSIRTATEFQVRATDEGDAGIHEDRPVSGRVALRNAEETLCGPDIASEGEAEDSNTESIPGTDDCKNNDVGLAPITGAGGSAPVVRTDIFTNVTDDSDEIGYYTFMAEARDKAGNVSAEIERTIVHDDVAPSIGISVLAAGNIDGPFDVTVLMADNLSLRDATGNALYGTDYTIRMVAAPFDAFNAAQLTQEHILRLPDVQPLLRLYGAGPTVSYNDEGDVTVTPNDLSSLAVALRDQGSGDPVPATATDLTIDDGVSAFGFTPEDLDPDGDGNNDDDVASTAPADQITSFAISEPAAAAADEDARTVEDGDDTVELEAVVVGTYGAFENPFERVEFYLSDMETGGVLYKVATTSRGEVDDDLVTADDDADDERTWTYTVEVSADDLWDTGGGDDADITRRLYAFGVGSKGTVALVTPLVSLIFEER